MSHSENTVTLPEPDSFARAHSDKVTARIREEIAAAGGMIDFSRFMELALYAPGLGYYASGQHKFGAAGDFVTAPEIGDVFARCVARQCAQVLTQLGSGDILEFGAGSGALAVQTLSALRDLGRLPRRYLILELSADLRDRQRRSIARRLPELSGRVRWLSRLPDKPFSGVVLANEVLDAMPVSRFLIRGGQVLALGVSLSGDRFVEVPHPASEPWVGRIEKLALPEGYRSEAGDRPRAWLATLAERLERAMVLVFDYGFPSGEYYHSQRSRGTMMCHYRHRAHGDPYFMPGLQDITAHVDFSALAAGGAQCGLSLMGYCDLASFTIAAGLLDILEQSKQEDTMQYHQATQQASTLTSPAEMGELFKAIAFGHGLGLSPVGFTGRDRRGLL